MKLNFKKKDKFIVILLIIIFFETTFLVSLWVKKIKLKVILPIAKAKIAIVIDDWGYNLNNINFLKQIELPITISILPNLPFSSTIAEMANQNKKEVILHLPLEPHNKNEISLEKNIILTNMSNSQILTIFNNSLETVPFAKGVNNHMGSKATEDEFLMTTLFKEFKKKGFFFLDSLVTSNSICKRLAKKIDIKFSSRTVFLDNKSDTAYIEKQLKLLVNKAKQIGFSVGIGHDRALTLETIERNMSALEKEGVKFVFLSEVVRRQ